MGLPIQAARPSALMRRPVRSEAIFDRDSVRTRDRFNAGRTVQLHRFPSIVNKVSCTEYIGVRSERRELKHLSTCRKGHQPRLRK